MLSSQTCCMICDFFISLARTEKKLEVIRQLLAKENEFEAYAVYKRIDRDINQILTAKEIHNFLLDNQINYSEEVIANSYIFHYDLDNDKGLVFSEFLRSVLPFDNPNLRSICTQRPTYNIAKTERLNEDLECLLTRFIVSEINAFLELEPAKQNIKNQADFSTERLFAQIDCDNHGYLDFENLLSFFSTHDYYPYEEEIISILRSFDKDEDGRLILQDLIDGMSPRYFKQPEIQKATMQPDDQKLTSQTKFTTPNKRMNQISLGSANKNSQLSSSCNKYPFEPLRKQISPNKQSLPQQSQQQQQYNYQKFFVFVFNQRNSIPQSNTLQSINKMKDDVKRRITNLGSSMLQTSQLKSSEQIQFVTSMEQSPNMISPAMKIKTFY